jgi:hypothetical protein
MVKRRVFDKEKHVQFATFSCDKRRTFLQQGQAKRVVIGQPQSYGFNIWSRQKVEEKLEYMHRNPVRAGLIERAEEYRWSSALWYFECKSVGLPIRWPPGLETEDEFVVGT